MKKHFCSFLFILSVSLSAQAQNGNIYQSLWQQTSSSAPAAGTRILVPSVYQSLAVNENNLESTLLNAGDYDHAIELALPTPDGSYRIFRIWKNTTMSQELQDHYPMIHTWTAEAINNRQVTAKLDYTLSGFHAMVFDNSGDWYIDPMTNQKSGFYTCYKGSDYTRPANHMQCQFKNNNTVPMQEEELELAGKGLPKINLKSMNGAYRKNYLLALACTGEYAVAVAGSSPTKPAVLSAMVTSMNRINGVYERELAVTMTMVDNTSIIFLDGATDPYTNDDGGTMLGENQSEIDASIGSSNYDIGHVFSTGGGGIANLGCVCSSGQKAMGVTGSPSPIGDSYDIDYVVHEMGHQFGGDHTFADNSNGSCAGNMASNASYEPGSGTTIMAYAGICDGDDIQPHSDAYFHAKSLDQISTFIQSGGGRTCPDSTLSTNQNAIMTGYMASYNIPASTPFELTAPLAVDATADTLTYCWEEYNRAPGSGITFAATTTTGPLFRSFNPSTSQTRVFPTPSALVAGTFDYLGEKLPTVTRTLRFKLTERDVFQGWGTFLFPADSVHIDVSGTSGPFLVTSPATSVTWTAGTTQTVNWNVAGTDATPINALTVDIYISYDGGYTFPGILATAVPNTGSATIVVPGVNTPSARIKVKGSGNIFFSLNPINFTIVGGTTGINTVSWADDVTVFPVPASEAVTIEANGRQLGARIQNTIGQTIWSGGLNNTVTIPVQSWASGLYYLHLTNAAGEHVVKTITIQ